MPTFRDNLSVPSSRVKQIKQNGFLHIRYRIIPILNPILANEYTENKEDCMILQVVTAANRPGTSRLVF